MLFRYVRDSCWGLPTLPKWIKLIEPAANITIGIQHKARDHHVLSTCHPIHYSEYNCSCSLGEISPGAFPFSKARTHFLTRANANSLSQF